jgi:hypothetical protein
MKRKSPFYVRVGLTDAGSIRITVLARKGRTVDCAFGQVRRDWRRDGVHV